MLHVNSSDRTSQAEQDPCDQPLFTSSTCPIQPQLSPANRDRPRFKATSPVIVRSLEADLAANLAASSPPSSAIRSRRDHLMFCLGVTCSVVSLVACLSSGALLYQTMRSIAIESAQTMMNN